jgi:hypothetical protein
LLEDLAAQLDGQLEKARTWDEATQTWLALAALNSAVGRDPQWSMRLKEFRQRLTFPRDRESAPPRDFDSPRDFVPPGLLRSRTPGK